MRFCKNIWIFILILGFAKPLFADAQEVSSPNISKPNIIVIMTDDQTKETAGFDGGMEGLTPFLDQLAEKGVSFSRMYVPLGICAPSRASFITGQMPHKHGLTANSIPIQETPALLSKVLHDNGYYTALVGKCHFGKHCHDPEDIPQDTPPGDDDEPDYQRLGFDSTITVRVPIQSYYRYKISENGKASEVAGPYLTDYTTDRAIEVIGRSVQANKPLFLWLAYNAPHRPFGHENLPPEYLSSKGGSLSPQITDFAAKQQAAIEPDRITTKPIWQTQSPWATEYSADPAAAADNRLVALHMIANIDHNIGRVIEALKQESAIDNTIILFISDNGLFFGEHGLIYKGDFLYEEQMRVPFFVSGVGIKRNVRTATPVSSIDIYPTLLDLIGVTPPKASKPDGMSFANFLTEAGQQNPIARPIALEFYRVGAEEKNYYPTRGLVTDRWKWIHRFPGKLNKIDITRHYHELYDLQADPKETLNLFADDKGQIRSFTAMLTDPTYGPVIKSLRLQQAQEMARTDDPWRPVMQEFQKGLDQGQMKFSWKTDAVTESLVRYRLASCQDCPWAEQTDKISGKNHVLSIAGLERGKAYDIEIYALDLEGSGDFMSLNIALPR